MDYMIIVQKLHEGNQPYLSKIDISRADDAESALRKYIESSMSVDPDKVQMIMASPVFARAHTTESSRTIFVSAQRPTVEFLWEIVKTLSARLQRIEGKSDDEVCSVPRA